MTGLLAFNDDIKSRRTASTGTMGLPKSLTRTRSLNAKYDRMLGSTQSVRSGKGSTKILAEVGTQFRLSGEEKKEKVQRDNAEIYRKLGIKMPSKGSREMEGTVGVMEKLERYRLGNIPPPRGNTPPVRLDEKLRKILYPSPPPPPPLTPTPPPIHLHSDHYYPTGSRVGHSMQGVYPQPSHQLDYRYETQPAPGPYPPLPPHSTIPQVQGWVFTPEHGWIFIPPPPPYHGYPAIPPPPPMAQGYSNQTAYPSPYSDVPLSSEDGQSPQRYYRNPPKETPHPNSFPSHHHQIVEAEECDEEIPPPPHHHPTYPHFPETPQQYQALAQTFPRGILRYESSSEISGHGRSVKFRNTPDYNSPEMYAQEIADGPSAATCSPPQWKLRKPSKVKPALDHDQQLPQANVEYYPENARARSQDLRDMEVDTGEIPTSPLRGRGQIDHGVPPLLAAVHRQLLSAQAAPSGASGKRTGRDLVRNLESLAEMEDGHREEVQPELPVRLPVYQQIPTPRRQDPTHDRMHIPIQSRSPICGDEGSRQFRVDRSKERHEPESNPVPRQPPPLHFEANTPRRKVPEIQHPSPRSQERTESREALTRDKVDGSERSVSPDAEERYEQPTQQHEDRTSQIPAQTRKVSTNNRLPPPSQNWTESQRPLMSFSQNESIASHNMGSPLPYGNLNRDNNTQRRSRKQGSQEGRDDEAEVEAEYARDTHPEQDWHRSQEDHQNQAIHQDSYSPHQDSQPNPKQTQARSLKRSTSQVTQDHQSQERHQTSSASQTSPPPTRPIHKKHRLTSLQIPIDDDPSDQSYRPSQAEEDEELEYNYSQTRSISPEEPEGKKMKLTECAWKYDISKDKLPIPPTTHVPFLQSYNKSRFSHLNKNRNQAKSTKSNVNDENIKSSQTQSVISQIENSDDEMDDWLNEDIEESLSQVLSDPPTRNGNRGEALWTINEDEEEEEDMRQGEVGRKEYQKSWVEEGFFGDGGSKGFEIWRDQC